MSKAVAYYRVSLLKKGKDEDSSLSLNSQRTAVNRFATSRGLDIVGEFQEVETGTKKKKRPVLQKAIVSAKENGAVLLIAKLDRLARNVRFIADLMESSVKFQAVDMPDIDNLTIHILAAVAEKEAELISRRTKAALTVLKARGVELGKPENMSHEAQIAGSQANREAARESYRKMVGYIKLLREGGKTFADIADKLNSEGHKTRQGKQFYPATIQRILDRV